MSKPCFEFQRLCVGQLVNPVDGIVPVCKIFTCAANAKNNPAFSNLVCRRVQGHGTHAAGVIAGTGNNGIGVAGVNWASHVVGCTMFPDDCTTAECPGSTSAAIKCLNWL